MSLGAMHRDVMINDLAREIPARVEWNLLAIDHHKIRLDGSKAIGEISVPGRLGADDQRLLKRPVSIHVASDKWPQALRGGHHFDIACVHDRGSPVRFLQ